MPTGTSGPGMVSLGKRKGTGLPSSSGFSSPLSYSPALWLKADALSQADGTAVTSWTDSSGFSRHATQSTGAQQPTFKTSILNSQPVVRFDGGDGLATASVALTAATGITTFVVASVLAVTDRILVEFSANYNSQTDAFALYRSTANKVVAAHKGNNSGAVTHLATSTPSFSGTSTYGIICSQHIKSFSMQEIGVSLANNWRYTYSPTGAATVGVIDNTNGFGTYAINIGARDALGTQTLPTNGDIAEVIIYPRFLSGAEIQNVGAYLAAKYGASLWNNQAANIVFEGDSLTEGDKLPTSAPPHQLVARLTDNAVWYCIPAVSGQTLVSMAADYASQILPLSRVALGSKNICVLWGGTNDMVSVGGNQTAATALARFFAYADTLRADGWYVIGVTMIPRTDAAAPGDFETKRGTFNTGLVAGYASHMNALAQPHLRAEFDAAADSTNLTFYNADLVHLSAAGYALIADDIETALGVVGVT